MVNDIDSTFLNLVNENLGIAHKIAGLYFDDNASREDVVQEMMYQLWRSFPTFDSRSKFSTWMYRVCLNTALTHFRKRKRTDTESLTPRHLDIPDAPSDDVHGLTILYQGIATLSKINKAIVLLYLDDLSYDEIASVTGLTRSNVSVRLFRIKRELESFIERQNQ